MDRPYHSVQTLNYVSSVTDLTSASIRREVAISEPALNRPRTSSEKNCHVGPYSDLQYIQAAELLDTFMGNSNLKKALVTTRQAMSIEDRHQVCVLAYDSYRYMKYIDFVIVQSQFLVNHSELVDRLALVKVLLYEAMRHHFDYSENGIRYANDKRIRLVEDLAKIIMDYRVRLGASYSRLRIEKQAGGKTSEEVLENILPQKEREKDKETISEEQVLRKMQKMGLSIQTNSKKEVDEDTIILDKDFDNLLVIPSSIFNSITDSVLIQKGWLVYQDKVSILGPVAAALTVKDESEPVILDCRAGNGTRVATISSLLHSKGKIFAVEDRPGRLTTMKQRFQLYNVQNAEIIPSSFLNLDPMDPHFEKVQTIICEPPSSGSAIIDKFSYVMQEEDLPEGDLSPQDIAKMQSIQLQMIEHALKFPNLKNIIYVTRSINFEENEETVCDILDHYTVELSQLFPQFVNDTLEDYEFRECLKLPPSIYGNGIYISALKVVEDPEEEETEQKDEPEETYEERVKRIEEKKKQRLIKRKLFRKQRQSVKRLYLSKSYRSLDFSSTKAKVCTNADLPIRPNTCFDSSQGYRIIPGLDIIGTGLGFRFHTHREISRKASSISLNVSNHWIYPVPNPLPWK